MKTIATNVLLTWTIGLFCLQMTAQAQPLAPPPEVAQPQPQAQLRGHTTLRFWGMALYEARLWTDPAFTLARFDQHPFALELAYRKAFKGRQIAQRSLSEMRRQSDFAPQWADAWAARLQALFPDVEPGDRITGIHLPGVGVRFLHNGRLLGEVADPLFARLFFGIWLSAQTSEPEMRCALAACS